jgi:hypothetical protein
MKALYNFHNLLRFSLEHTPVTWPFANTNVHSDNHVINLATYKSFGLLDIDNRIKKIYTMECHNFQQ